jgi:hypothetical protein
LQLLRSGNRKVSPAARSVVFKYNVGIVTNLNYRAVVLSRVIEKNDPIISRSDLPGSA